MADSRIWDGVAADNDYGTAANWSGDAVPAADDDAIFPAMAADSTKDVTTGLAQGGVALVDFAVENGCYLNFGSRLGSLVIDAAYFNYAGRGIGYFEIDNSTEIRVTDGMIGSGDDSYGLSLTGTTNALLIIDAGTSNTVGVAAFAEESATFTTIEISSGTVVLGAAITCTTLSVTGGTVESSTDVTTMNVNSGTITQHKNKPTTLNVNGGRIYYNSADAPTSVILKGGILDMSQDSRAKTFAAVTQYPGAVVNDPNNVLTITTHTRPVGGALMIS